MNKREAYAKQLEIGITEMEAAVERLREEIDQLTRERDKLQRTAITVSEPNDAPDF